MQITSRRKAYRCLLMTSLLLISVYIVLFKTELVFFQLGRKAAPIALLRAFNKTLRDGENVKTILLWNNFFSEEHFSFGVGQAAFVDAGCAESNCAIWDEEDGDTNLPYDSFDAVVFHASDLPTGTLFAKRPQVRKPNQLYTFMQLEAPATNKFNYVPLADFFNLTMTYRRDSDIYSPYGWLASADTSSDVAPKQSASKVPIAWMEPRFGDLALPTPWTLSGKSKTVAWIVSNCYTPSRRELYVRELAKHVDVDVFGDCGYLACGVDQAAACYQMVEENYLFYLSFENSLCTDYVTEKFFNILQYDVVPVVYGGAQYEQIAPPMSYIDVLDFASPRELANYLKYLSETPAEYEKYFWWKKHYQVVHNFKASFCALCEVLHGAAEHSSRRYADLEAWWNAPNVCHSPESHFLKDRDVT